MAMDTIFATLAFYLLALSCVVAQMEKRNLITPKIANLDLSSPTDLTQVTETITPSNLTENTTPFTNTTRNETFTTTLQTTLATTGSTSPLQTSQSTAIMTPLTNSTSLTTKKPATHTPTFTAITTPAMHTTVGYISTSDTAVITANSSYTVNTTSHSLDRTTQALRLNISDKNITIVFSVVLGVLVLTLVVFTFHKCKQKIQYLHQPLNNSDDTDAFVADDDTLVISGGLYDGHPIYDNVPTASEDRSQFHLEFRH